MPTTAEKKAASAAGAKENDVKPADVKPADVKPADVKPADVKPADVKAGASAVVPEFDFTAVKVTDATALPKKRSAKKAATPNPFLPVVQQSIDSDFKVKNYGPIPDNVVKSARSLMHRAARELGYGLKIGVTDHGNGTTTIGYQVKKEKKVRKYTTADVRAWLNENGRTAEAAASRIPAVTLKEYRTAKGIS